MFSADRFTIDGTSGKVSALVDWMDSTHTLAQATSANQAAAPAADSAVRGARSLTFTGSQLYVSSRAASTWKYLHDGTGFAVVAVFVPDTGGGSAAQNTIASTVRGADIASASGLVLSYTTTTTTGGLVARVARANATPTINQTPTTVFTQSTAYSLRFDYLEGAGTEYHLSKSGVSLATGASLAAPTATDPQGTLTIGANVSDASNKLTGRLAFFATAPAILTAAQATTLSAYLTQKYGVAA